MRTLCEVVRVDRLWATRQDVVRRLAPVCLAEVESLAPTDLRRLAQIVRMVCPSELGRLRSSRVLAGVAPRRIRRVALHSQPRADATRADRRLCKRARMVFVMN